MYAQRTGERGGEEGGEGTCKLLLRIVSHLVVRVNDKECLMHGKIWFRSTPNCVESVGGQTRLNRPPDDGLSPSFKVVYACTLSCAQCDMFSEQKDDQRIDVSHTHSLCLH